MTRPESTLSPENQLVYFPLTQAQIARIPQAIRTRFSQHLDYVNQNHKLLTDRSKGAQIRGIRYDVKKVQREREDVVSFYHQSEHERTTTDLVISRSNGKIVGVEVISDTSKNGLKDNMFTILDLRGGVLITQDASPPIMLSGSSFEHARQIFVFEENRSPLAQLLLRVGEVEYELVTITPTEEHLHLGPGRLRTDFATNTRVIETEYGSLSLPSPDEFVATALRNALLFQPVRIITQSS